MKRAPLRASIVILILIHATAGAFAVTAENTLLNPPSAMTSQYFKQLCGVFITALDIYRMDAVRGMHKEDIIRARGSDISINGARFDLDSVDSRRKGWTRYYPVYIDGRQFIVRIYLTAEASYQEKVAWIEKMDFTDPAVTVELLPGLNDILESEPIRPIRLDPVSPADRSS